MNDVETQPRSTLVAASGEERIEGMPAHFICHADAVVGIDEFDKIITHGLGGARRTLWRARALAEIDRALGELKE